MLVLFPELLYQGPVVLRVGEPLRFTTACGGLSLTTRLASF